MMLLLLVVLTLSVLVVPLLPALREWLWPSDVVPLKIDEADALDPPYLAHSFAALLHEAVQAGATHLGGTPIVQVVPGAAGLPLLLAETSAGRSDRLWCIEGSVQLPDKTHFYAEVSAAGDVHTAPHGVYRALWAGARATLAPFSTVLRWAHGHEVHVGAGSHLAGRVTAQQAMTLESGVDFMLLHAPRIGCVVPEGHPLPPAPLVAPPCIPMAEWPVGAVWNPGARRAFARSALQIDAQHSWRGDVVCLADLVLGPHCQADGSLKARRDLMLGEGCQVSGSVVAEGTVHLAAHCTVRGSVLSETAIVLEAGCTIGAPGQPATVTAPQIQMAPGVTVYGTVWAEEKGWTGERVVPEPAVEPSSPPLSLHPVAAWLR